MSLAKRVNREEAHIRPVPLREVGECLQHALEHDSETATADAVNILISQGAYHGASDIHLEPWKEHVAVRYRIDGILHDVALLPRDVQPKLVARIKVLAELIVYRKDVPQDGRIEAEKSSCGRPMRVATIPTIKGETVALRLLGHARELYAMNALGFEPEIVEDLRDLVDRGQGTLLLTGPSSSGKTTTIYAMLNEMVAHEEQHRNIVTIEDPVEYGLDRITQIQVNPHVEFTFTSALRNVLRQDPEVIMVGEIRDQETAKIAVQAGLTGHFVISTIHSGTAAGVFTRLLDMGIEPYLVASSVCAVLAQRLVRLNCPKCRAPYKPDPILLEYLGVEKSRRKFQEGQGCDACQGIGYRSRAAIGELLTVSQAVAELVLKRPTTARLHAEAVAEGMTTLLDDGLIKAGKGATTIEELVRVLPTRQM